MLPTRRIPLYPDGHTGRAGLRAGRALAPILMALFLAAAMACAAGSLFLKNRLEYARAFSIDAVREQFGVEFNFRALRAQGVRTLQVVGLHVSAGAPGLGNVALDVESLQVRLSLSDLLLGRATAGEAIIQGGHLVIEPIRSAPEKSSGNGSPLDLLQKLMRLPGMKISGKECTIELKIKDAAGPLLFKHTSFVLMNRPQGSEMQASLQTEMVSEDNTCLIGVSASYRLPAGLEADAAVTNLTPEHLAWWVPGMERVQGNLTAGLHISGKPEESLILAVEADAAPLHVVGIPDVFQNMEGHAKAMLTLDLLEKRATVHSCALVTSMGDLQITGTADLGKKPVEIDAAARATRLNINPMIAAFMPEPISALGKMDVNVEEGMEVLAEVRGAVDALKPRIRFIVPEASVSFAPNKKELPKGNIRIANADMVWDDFKALPRGTLIIKGGTVNAARFGLSAENIAGVIALTESGVSLHPATLVIAGRPWSGTLEYKMPGGELLFSVAGSLTDVDQTPLHDLVKDLKLGGDLGVRCNGVYGPGGKLQLTGSAEVTRGMVAFEWWLRKPVGVGASIRHIEVDMRPGKHLKIKGEAFIEDTRILADLFYLPRKGKWHGQRIRVDIPHLEINSAGKCIVIPYTALGTFCRDGYYESNALSDHRDGSIATFAGHFDSVSFLADGGQNPLVCRDADVKVVLTDIKQVERRADLTLHVAEAHVPPFGEDWLLPLGPPKEEEEKKSGASAEPEPLPQPWTYALSADAIEVPPWQGRNFKAEVHSNDEGTAFQFFEAEVGDGRLNGVYNHRKETNEMRLEADWNHIPVAYLIRHLELPEILTGNVSGKAVYTVDQDDPGATMNVEGQFAVSEGHFIPEQLRDLFKESLGGGLLALHPDALAFQKVTSDLRVAGDQIHTNNLMIQSEGMKITADGVWVMQGDLDYKVNLAITPDLADQIPLLRDNFNVQGFRMTQRDIELGFHVTGPTFNPTGQLAGLPPVGVTLVSGAAEMTGEAFRLFDLPRQLFMSVVRAGGGILGSTMTQQQQKTQQPPQQ